MKPLAVLIAVALAWNAVAAPAAEVPSTAPASGSAPEVILSVSTITVTAPRVSPSEVRVLKTAQAGGAAAGVAGLGWMSYVVYAGLGGPFGWAAALVFLGGMTAYLSHRRLEGDQDFPEGTAGKPPPAETAAAGRK